jgi:hypothetical protein
MQICVLQSHFIEFPAGCARQLQPSVRTGHRDVNRISSLGAPTCTSIRRAALLFAAVMPSPSRVGCNTSRGTALRQHKGTPYIPTQIHIPSQRSPPRSQLRPPTTPPSTPAQPLRAARNLTPGAARNRYAPEAWDNITLIVGETVAAHPPLERARPLAPNPARHVLVTVAVAYQDAKRLTGRIFQSPWPAMTSAPRFTVVSVPPAWD